MSLLQKSAGSRDLPNRQSEALEMTEIWPPEGAIAHLRAVSMCRVSLDTAVDTFATGSYGQSTVTVAWSLRHLKCSRCSSGTRRLLGSGGGFS